MPKVTIGRGSARVILDDGLRRLVERAARNAAPRAFRSIELVVDAIETDAKARWPVGRDRHGVKDGEGRPHSRDLLEAEIVIDPGGSRVTGRIVNSADYAYKIKTSQNGVSGSPWQELVAKPMRAVIRELAEDMAAEIKEGATSDRA